MTSFDHALLAGLTRDADDMITAAERSLLSDASKQRDMWRHDVTACQRHVSQLTAHVSQLTSGDAWRHFNTDRMPSSFLPCDFLLHTC